MFDDLNKALKDLPKQLIAETERIIKANDNVVIDDITEKQLFEKGEDGLGISLGNYTPFTVQQKQIKGQRSDHITLKDTGDFYSSFKLSINGLVTADGQKEDTNLITEYGNEILIWSDENQDDFIDDTLREGLQKFTRKKLC